MPDWSYQTLFRPVLFRLPARGARDLVLSLMGTLARVPMGSAVIDLLGHMRPDERLSRCVGGLDFPTPVGLGSVVDPNLMATRALARFGFGFIDVGPITLNRQSASGPIALDPAKQQITSDDTHENPGLAATVRRLRGLNPGVDRLGVKVIVRLDASTLASPSAAQQIVSELAPYADIFAIPAPPGDMGVPGAEIPGALPIDSLRNAGAKRVLLVVSATPEHPPHEGIVELARSPSIDGLIIDAAIRDDSSQRTIGPTSFDALRDAVAYWRKQLGPDGWVIARGGIHEPQQALEITDGGADLLEIDSGLIFSGPGLPKRINDAILYDTPRPPEPPAPEVVPPSEVPSPIRGRGRGEQTKTVPASPLAKMSWLWAMLMGVGMFVGGLMTMAIAVGPVVLPYDESIAGMTRDQLAAVNDHLLDFMTHDRVTLAGTMLSVGTLYLALSVFGIRRGLHWAYVTVLSSAWCGFVSFFSFLGFGYFDPLHAFVTAVLLQLLLFMHHCNIAPRDEPIGPNVRNDRPWRLSQWGQLIFVIHGVLILTAGAVISKIGITQVFVPEDLEFMKTTADQLHGAHPNLVPLVAHDRATFGGMLLSCGVAALLPALWGFRRGHAWLWWALMISGNVAYWATLLVHWDVGYLSLKHLVPVYLGLALLWIGAALSYPYLCSRDAYHERYWDLRLAGRP